MIEEKNYSGKDNAIKMFLNKKLKDWKTRKNLAKNYKLSNNMGGL
jgi:hypothetical protein